MLPSSQNNKPAAATTHTSLVLQEYCRSNRTKRLRDSLKKNAAAKKRLHRKIILSSNNEHVGIITNYEIMTTEELKQEIIRRWHSLSEDERDIMRIFGLNGDTSTTKEQIHSPEQ